MFYLGQEYGQAWYNTHFIRVQLKKTIVRILLLYVNRLFCECVCVFFVYKLQAILLSTNNITLLNINNTKITYCEIFKNWFNILCIVI